MEWFINLLRTIFYSLYPREKLSPVEVIPEPAIVTVPSTMPEKTNAERLYEEAVANIGTDVSPLDKAPDSLACMESVDGLWYLTFGEHLLSPESRLSTNAGYKAMLSDKRLKQIYTPQLGAIVISPTGYSTKQTPHGHTGICGNFDIMSNDSGSGKWSDNYTKDAWVKVFHNNLGFPVYYFLPI